MNSYVNKDEVRVFPSTRRSNTQQSSRYQQESTYVDIIRRICDYNDGTFVYTQPTEQFNTGTNKYELYYDSKSPFEFFIYGYWFRLSTLDSIFTALGEEQLKNATNIYAYINLDKYQIGNDVQDENKKEYRIELNGRDDFNGQYLGLKFDTVKPTITDTTKYIHLFQRDLTTTSWNTSIVINSLFKLNMKMMNISIDGGVII